MKISELKTKKKDLEEQAQKARLEIARQGRMQMVGDLIKKQIHHLRTLIEKNNKARTIYDGEFKEYSPVIDEEILEELETSKQYFDKELQEDKGGELKEIEEKLRKVSCRKEKNI